ncbi:MAG: DUF308 domain-containing protein [Eubacteriales bacterium]
MNVVKKAKAIYIASSATIFLLGIALLIFPHMSERMLVAFIAGVFIFVAAAKLFGFFSNDMYKLAFQFDLALGIFAAIIAVLVIVRYSDSFGTVANFVGAYTIVDSLFKAQTAFDAKRFGMSKWLSIFIASVVVGIVGILNVFNPFEFEYSGVILTGICFLASGAENIWVTAYTVKVKTAKKNYKKE